MTIRARGNHTPAVKAKLALRPSRVIELWLSWRGNSTSALIRSHSGWKAQLKEGAPDVFGSRGGNGAAQPAVDVKSFHAKSES
jgi:transposase